MRALLFGPATPAVTGRLRAQLADLGVPETEVVGGDIVEQLRRVGAAAREAAGPLVLAQADVLSQAGVLGALARPGVTATVALVSTQRGTAAYPPVTRRRGRVISAGSHWHQVTRPNGSFRGVLRVAPPQLARLASTVDGLLRLTPERLADWACGGGTTGLVLLALLRAGVRVGAQPLRGFVAVRTADPAALELVPPEDERRRLRLAVKEHDDLFATYGVSPYSPRLARRAARLGLSPTGVTWISIGLAGLAAAAFALGARGALLAGSGLLYLAFLFDCVDGQLARYTARYSRYGGWLDAVADRAKEYVVYAGLAVGAARTGHGYLWPFAVALLILQAVRHMTDTWYGALQESAVDRLPRNPVEVREDGLNRPRRIAGRSAAARLGDLLGRLSNRATARPRSPAYWFKRTMVFPIGDRWALIMLTVAVSGAGLAFDCLLAWSVLATGYTLPGRTLRGLALAVPTMTDHDVPTHRDDGVLAKLIAGADRRHRLRPLATAGTAAVVALVLLLLGAYRLGPAHLDATGEGVIVAALAGLLVAALSGRHRHDGALDWLVSAALRAAEFVFIVLVARNDGIGLPLTFALLTTVALYHYDLAARLDKRASPLRDRRWALGWDGRATVLAGAAVCDLALYAFYLLTAYLLVVLVLGALAGTWRRRPAPAAPAKSTVEGRGRIAALVGAVEGARWLPHQRRSPEQPAIDTTGSPVADRATMVPTPTSGTAQIREG